MDAGSQSGVPTRFERALAGFQAGMAGACVLLLWLGMTSVVYRRSVWSVVNLMASAFYGEAALRPRLSWASVAGAAVYLIVYSALGALFGMLVHTRLPRLRLALLGILAGVFWYYLAFRVIWIHLAPLVPLYTLDGPMLVGHVLYGLLLARISNYLSPAAAAEAPAVVAAEQAATPLDNPVPAATDSE